MSKRHPNPGRPKTESRPRRTKGSDPVAARWEEPEGPTLERIGELVRRFALAALACLITSRVFYPSEDAPTGTGLWWVFAVLIVLGAAIAAGLLQERFRFRISPADLCAAALVGLVALSVRSAWEIRPAITMAWEWVGLGVVYLLIRNLPRTRSETSALGSVWAAAAIAVAVYGLYQVAVEIPGLQAQFRAEPDRILRRMGIEPGTPSAASFQARLLDSNEPFSTFALANSLAGFLVGPLVVLIGLIVENLRPALRGRSSRGAAYLLAAPVLLALVACLLATKSRSAYLGLLVGSAWVIVRAWARVSRRSLLLVAGGGAVVVAGLVAAGLATGRLDREVLTESTKSLAYRLEYWQGTWNLINNRDVPYEPRLATPIGGELLTQAPSARPEARAFWEGLGPANFGGPYLRHKLPTSSEEIQDPHDFALEIWACSGLTAMIAALAWLTSGLGVVARGEPEVADEAGDRPDDPAAGRWIVAGGAAGWVLVAVLGRLDPFKGDLLMRWIVLGAAWGIGLATIHPLWNRRAIPASLFGAALIAICVNLLAAGGISVPAVALGVWIPLAIGLTLRETSGSGRIREVPGIGLGVLAAIVWAALVGTFYGSVSPHWRSEAAIARGDAYAGAPLPAYEKARAEYLDACTLDRFASAPWISLATLEFRYWTSPEGGQKSGHWRNIFQTLDKAVQPPLRNPDALPVRRFQATMARQVLQRLPGAIPMEILFLREQIARAARNQARLYPTSAEIRAQLAFASAELGMYDDAISEAKIALELDGITPHADKKLAPAVRVQLQGAIANWTEAASAAAAIRKPKE